MQASSIEGQFLHFQTLNVECDTVPAVLRLGLAQPWHAATGKAPPTRTSNVSEGPLEDANTVLHPVYQKLDAASSADRRLPGTFYCPDCSGLGEFESCFHVLCSCWERPESLPRGAQAGSPGDIVG